MTQPPISGLMPAIECMEDKDFSHSSILRSKNYFDIISALKSPSTLPTDAAERLIEICLVDFSEDLQYTSSAMVVISLVLKKIKEGKCVLSPILNQKFQGTAKAILNITKKLLRKSLLRKMAIDTLLLHPDDILRSLVVCSLEEVLELIDFHPKLDFQPDVTEMMLSIIGKILRVLQEGDKMKFMKRGLRAWFNSVIPGVVHLAAENPESLKEIMDNLELLVENLENINYSDYTIWQVILRDICNKSKIPAILKKLVDDQNECWHRLWMVFIRLLKDQITKVDKSGVSPINALLPVVELAFKLNPECRCRAFESWNVLIDNFATELNEALINKRLKLLVIPLKLNNAKVPLTVMAKFKTWWHLIRKFQSKIDNRTDVLLTPFLQFCFGKANADSSKPVVTPGMLTEELSKQSVEALVEIIGHVDCSGCVTIPRLQQRVICTKILVDHWNELLHALSVAIDISAVNCTEKDIQRVRCLWKGFTRTIAELPDNQIRADLVVELLKSLASISEKAAKRPKLAELVFDVLICSLFDDDNIKPLMKTKNEDGPIYLVLGIIFGTHLDGLFLQTPPEEIIAKVKPITTYIMDPSVADSHQVINTQVVLPSFSATRLLFWAALADTICESKQNLNESTLTAVILWPLKAKIMPDNIQVAQSEVVWYKWYTLYSYLHPIMPTNFDDQIRNLTNEDNPFCLCTTIALLKQKLCIKDEKCHLEAITLLKSMERVPTKSLDKYLPILIDTLVLLVNLVTEKIDIVLAQSAFNTIAVVLKHFCSLLSTKVTENGQPVTDISLLEHLIKPIDNLIKVEKYSNLVPTIANLLCDLKSLTNAYSTINKGIVEILVKLAPHFYEKSLMCQRIIYAIQDSASTKTSEEISVTKTDKPEMSKTKTDKSETSETKKPESKASQPKNKKNDTKISGQDECNISQTNAQSVSSANECLKKVDIGTEKQLDENKNNFPTPGIKSAKKTKKKDVNIVNTVVENGEEFVVVKSHWKFNPKKLTEHQKEKLKRKRVDIPALYQDLSQSQDEFKLTTWKSDSQDASTTASTKSESNSNSNNDVPNILKNIPSTDVVPKIIENIFPHITNKVSDINIDKSVDTNDKTQSPTVKEPKTPRMALKDRVFRNVRNLIEKSGTQSASKIQELDVENNLRLTNENDITTPVTPLSKVISANQVSHSAPPKIKAERPSRLIKKPKKFDDTQVFAMKKKKRSKSTQSDSQPDTTFESQQEADKIDESKSVLLNENIETEQIKVTKKPKKFDDTQVFAMKKKKRSKSTQSDSQSDSQPDTNFENQQEADKINKSKSVLLSENIETEQINVTKDTTEKTNIIPDSVENECYNTEEPKIYCPDTSENNANVEIPQTHQTNEKIKDNCNKEAQGTCENSTSEQAPMEEPDMCSQTIEEIQTPVKSNIKRKDNDESTIKKKRSRIEKQLLIDMVEGHPLLQQSESKRLTRKNLTNESNDNVTKRRKSLIEKSHKILAELENVGIVERKTKDKDKTSPKSTKSVSGETNLSQELTQSQPITIVESQENIGCSQDVPMSEDVIESSQDSSITTISVKSSASKKRIPVVRLDKDNPLSNKTLDSQKLLDDFNEIIPLNDSFDQSNDDIELSKNKTMGSDNPQDLTENMDTEPMDTSGEVIIVSDEPAPPIVINTEDTCVGKETQELAEADTLPMNAESQLTSTTLETNLLNNTPTAVTLSGNSVNRCIQALSENNKFNSTANDTTVEKSQIDTDTTNVSQANITPIISVSAEAIADIIQESSNSGSPSKDDITRRKAFLNDTIELSPIKILSPIPETKPTSPETSSDYVVIKLTSPVQSNGEPFDDKCESPEVFTEDKVSPDKRDQSPPRKDVSSNNQTSPSSSLSLKKNRPQMRSGRAAQMLELCVPNSSKSDEEAKKSSPASTPAKRNLRKLYTTENNENQDSDNNSEENENFLKFTRTIPTSDCSPAGPILKRKLAEITDEATPSPASKRKRVSFHDPPVSTTVAVQKYLEPFGVRSPSNSAIKRHEKQLRGLTYSKSPKRLDTVFRLDSALTKTVESFSQDVSVSISNETEISLDETPAVEVIKTSELNDVDPICPELLDCKDPIENIASELSSPSTKALLIKELEGKVECIADLAKMTELEVNRLCIKAPKVKVAKKVLVDYSAKRAKAQEINTAKTPLETVTCQTQTVEEVIQKSDIEIQTNQIVTKSCEIQTEVRTSIIQTQTETVPTANCSTQANQSTKDLVASCLVERPDFVDQLTKQLEESAVRRISENLSSDVLLSLLMNKMNSMNSQRVVREVLTHSVSLESSKGATLNLVQEYLSSMFDSKDLILFCSQLLKKIHDK